MATDLYSLFAIPRHASQSQIKTAYHRLLLQSHPDKCHQHSQPNPDIGLIKHAYTTLSSPSLRAAYDASLDATKDAWHSRQTIPRPAQLVSLEEFEEDPHPTDQPSQGPWRYPCRCGGSYTISTTLMEDGKHLVACTNCSEVIWVGYEQVEQG